VSQCAEVFQDWSAAGEIQQKILSSRRGAASLDRVPETNTPYPGNSQTRRVREPVTHRADVFHDWKSVGLQMADLYQTPSRKVSLSTRSPPTNSCSFTFTSSTTLTSSSTVLPAAAPFGFKSLSNSQTIQTTSSSLLPENNQVKPDARTEVRSIARSLKSDLREAGDDSKPASCPPRQSASELALKPPNMTFFAPCYPFSPLSAVSGVLWDPPANMTVPSIPLPEAPSSWQPEIPSADVAACRSSLLPYPDVFDLSMYDYRASRNSDYDGWEVRSECKTPSDEQRGEGPRPLTVSYDAERDRNRFVNTTEPPVKLRTVKRIADLSPSVLPAQASSEAPCTSHEHAEEPATLPQHSDESDEESISAQLLAACADMSRCEWTEEEFLNLFAASS